MHRGSCGITLAKPSALDVLDRMELWGRPLSKNDLGHHSLIFMVQEMAME
jgi:hypothetical protein